MSNSPKGFLVWSSSSTCGRWINELSLCNIPFTAHARPALPITELSVYCKCLSALQPIGLRRNPGPDPENNSINHPDYDDDWRKWWLALSHPHTVMEERKRNNNRGCCYHDLWHFPPRPSPQLGGVPLLALLSIFPNLGENYTEPEQRSTLFGESHGGATLSTRERRAQETTAAAAGWPRKLLRCAPPVSRILILVQFDLNVSFLVVSRNNTQESPLNALGVLHCY